MGGMSTDDLPRLARAVKERRLALRLALLKAAKQAELAKDTWRHVEDGRRARDVTYAAMEPVLGWAAGSCRSILAGGTPTLAAPSATDPSVILAEVPEGDLAKTVRRVVESATIATTDDLTAEKIRNLSARVVEDLRREGVI